MSWCETASGPYSRVTPHLHSFNSVWAPLSESSERLFFLFFFFLFSSSCRGPGCVCFSSYSVSMTKRWQNTALALIPQNKKIHHTHGKKKYIQMPFLMIVSSLAERHCSCVWLPSALTPFFSFFFFCPENAFVPAVYLSNPPSDVLRQRKDVPAFRHLYCQMILLRETFVGVLCLSSSRGVVEFL